MRIKLVILLLSGILFSLSNAQAEVDSLHIFKKHSLQFRVNDFITLSSFKGSLLSYKYHSSDKSAFRMGLSARARNTDQEQSQNDSIRYYTQDRNYTETDIIVMVEYLRYFNPESDIKMFAGIGPRILFSIDDVTSDNVSSNSNDYKDKSDTDRYQIGLTLSYGLEWFFMKNMSVHADYGFNVSYIYEKSKHKRIRNNQTLIENDKRETTDFEFTERGVLFGLSVYF